MPSHHRPPKAVRQGRRTLRCGGSAIPPAVFDRSSEPRQRGRVARDTVIRIVSAYLLTQCLLLLSHRQVPIVRHHCAMLRTAPARRLAAVLCLTTQFPRWDSELDVGEAQKVKAAMSRAPLQPSRPVRMREAGSRVFSGCMMRPHLPNRIGSTCITRRASCSSVKPMTRSSASRTRCALPLRAGLTSRSNQSSST